MFEEHVSVSNDLTLAKFISSDQQKKQKAITLTCTTVPLSTIPNEILAMQQLSSLCLSQCQLQHVPKAITLMANLTCLHLQNNKIEEFPDLTSMTHLQQLTLTGNPITAKTSQPFKSALQTSSWNPTRLYLLELQKTFGYFGATAAVIQLFCIKKFAKGSIFDLIGMDVVKIIVHYIWKGRGDKEWNKADNLLYNIKKYHCFSPVPFATCYGPSVFYCACGYQFGDPNKVDVNDDNDIAKLKRSRNEHFKIVYKSDDRGYSTPTSRHYPLNRCVQRVLTRLYSGETKRNEKMEKEVVRLLTRRTQGKVRFATNPSYFFPAFMHHDANVNAIYAELIMDDIRLCIDDYLVLRALGFEEKSGKNWYGWFNKKAQEESKLLLKK